VRFARIAQATPAGKKRLALLSHCAFRTLPPV